MSVPPAELLEAGLIKIDEDLAFVMECLREVLVELGEGNLAQFVPWTGTEHTPTDDTEYPARLGSGVRDRLPVAQPD